MPRNRKQIGIQTLLLRVFLPVVALAALLVAILVYNRINATILRQFDDRLVATSALTGALIDPADHDWLIGTATSGRDPAAAERDIRYRRNVEPMRRIRERLGLTYIYTQVTSGRAEVRYILDGTDGDEHTPLGSPDSLPEETMAGLRDVQRRRIIYVSPVEYQEKWGLLKTAAAPVYSADGAVSGTAGADVNVSVIRVATQNALFLSAMIGIASLLACLLVTLQIVRRVARPIERLTQEALRIAAGDHRPPAKGDAPREVRDLRAALTALSAHATGELDAAAARAAQHRLAASEAWLFGDEGGARVPVMSVDSPNDRSTAAPAPIDAGEEISADVIDHMAVLAAIAPFDRLSGRELLLVARHVRPRSLPPGALLIERGQPAHLLYIAVDGWAMAGEARAPSLFDVPSLLFSLPAAQDYRVGDEGMQALCLARAHLFTIARECPQFIAGLLDMEALPSCG
ncbi:HAMP domain-containing protein [Sphingopyxis lindanitolerans]|nr:HAMP domain-containing protein [Sphingopyxis lindanitolerans]